MTRLIQFIRTVAAGAALGMVGCHQPSPPAVAVAPAAAEEPPARPRAAAGLKKLDETVAKSREPIPDGGTFPFPDDTGGKVLATTLAPATPKPTPAEGPAAPRERKLPATVDPASTLPDPAVPIPRLPLSPSPPLRPVPLPDRVPSDLGGPLSQLPARPELTTGPLTRQEGRDPARPAELPTLSPRPVADRAPLADPTVEFTARSMVSPSLPLRTEPTGFVRHNLPDPFEHADAARPRTPVVDDPNRSLATPPPPK